MRSFYPVPSLKYLALVKITSTLWDIGDVVDIEHCLDWPRSQRAKDKYWTAWLKVENKVLEKVSTLPLPNPLKTKLSCFVRPFGLEIGTWVLICRRERCLIPQVRNNIPLALTSRGTIDKKRMAELFVQDESVDIKERFDAACIFCLEDYIFSLWPLLPDRHPYKDPDYLRENYIRAPFQLLYWLYTLNGNTDENWNFVAGFIALVFPQRFNFQELAFWLAADHGNEVATRYFYGKLTPTEQAHMLVRTAENVIRFRHITLMTTICPDESDTDILCFLLSAMNKEQQSQLFIHAPYGVIACFFDWPWQEFFSEMLECVKIPHFPNYSTHILMIIQEKITLGFKDYNYNEFFGTFWPRVAVAERCAIVDQYIKRHLLDELIKTKDEENITLFLNDAAIVVSEKNIFCKKGRKICESLMNFELWHLLKLFIQNYALSKGKLINLKGQIKDSIICTRGRKKYNYKVDKFLNLIDELIQECDKRINEGEDRPAKRICSEVDVQV